jgi:CDP-glycerol glycerophosphotransferase (TagB/SpsB family)
VKNQGIYYLAKEASQFTSIESLYNRIRGTFLTWEIIRSRVITRKWPITWWNTNFFPRKRDLNKFKKEIEFLFPSCSHDTVHHFFRGPYSKDIKVLICMTMYPIPPKNKRNFTTFQFYHGVTDKRYKVNNRKEYPARYDQWDYWMLSGEKDRQKLLNAAKLAGIILKDESLVKIGHLRFDKLINKQYDKSALMELAGIPENGRKNILFAPTWKWGGGTLMSHYQEFCIKIPEKYNLIIRNHTNDTRNIEVVKQFCREKEIKNVYFVDNGIMNIIDNIIFSDMMISDPSSSVMYDFLITNRPLIMNKNTSPDVSVPEYQFDVRRCGFEYDIEKEEILDVIEKSFTSNKFEQHIKEVCGNSFYFTDGKSTERAENFIQNILNQNTNRKL